MANKKKKFTGPLSKKRKPRRLGIIEGKQPQMRDKAIKRWVEEDHLKLVYLCKHYGIKEGPTQFWELSLALAKESVPWFQVERKTGPKIKWTAWNKACLVVEIDRLIDKNYRFRGVKFAAEKLSKKEPWKSFLKKYAKDSSYKDNKYRHAETLRRTYYDFKNNDEVKYTKEIFQKYNDRNDLESWDKYIKQCVRNL